MPFLGTDSIYKQKAAHVANEIDLHPGNHHDISCIFVPFSELRGD